MMKINPIVTIQVMVTAPPPPPPIWRLSLKEFSIHGGFRGVHERCERDGCIAVVIIEEVSPNTPKFMRPGSPFTRICALYVGNFLPAYREEIIAEWMGQWDFTSRRSPTPFMFSQDKLVSSVTP
jgi:hypothetical protein